MPRKNFSGESCRTESDLLVACLIFAGAIDQILKGNLLGLWPPCVRQYGIFGYIASREVLRQLEVVATAFQKAHFVGRASLMVEVGKGSLS